MSQNHTLYGLGRRKRAVAQVLLNKGTGIIKINGRSGNEYLQENKIYLQKISAPLNLLELENQFDISVKTYGGGLTGQTDAISLGIARALKTLKTENQEILKTAGFLSRNSKVKERKKYGLKKARKASQFSKR